MTELLNAPSRPATGFPERARHRARTVVTAAVSLLIVLAAAAYVLGPSDPSVALTVSELSGAQPFDHDVAPRYSLAAARRPLRPKWTETVYGRVDSRGVPVSGISLRVDGAERATREQAAYVAIGRTGTYRAVLHLRPGKYRLTLSLKVRGTLTSLRTNQQLKDRRYYRVTATVRQSGAVTFLPVTTY